MSQGLKPPSILYALLPGLKSRPILKTVFLAVQNLRRCLSLFITLLTLTAAAQHPTYRIAGTAIDAVDTRPLQQATLQLLDTNSKPIQSSTSDAYGHFAFPTVPAGTWILQATATGYLTTQYEQHNIFTTAIVTGAGVDTESLVLQVRPVSIIRGTVTGDASEPVANATVRLFRARPPFSGRSQPVATANTDDLGQFEFTRFTRLTPGDYFIAVIARPWFAIHPNFQGDYQVTANRGGVTRPFLHPEDHTSGLVQSIDPTLDVAYPITFYPGVTDPARAETLTLRGGDTRDLTFHLSSVRAVTVTIDETPGRNAPPLLTANFRGVQLDAFGAAANIAGQAIFTGVAPGDYTASTLEGNRSLGPLSLQLSGTTASASMPSSAALAHLHVVLHAADGRPAGGNLTVSLVRARSSDSDDASPDAKGEAAFEAQPGDYFLEITDGKDNVHSIRQIRAGAETVPNTLHLAAGQSLSLDVTCVNPITTLKGFARKDGKAAPGALILMFATADSADIHHFYRQQSDLDGSWFIEGVNPGDYTIVALDSAGWDQDWDDPGALDRYLPAATRVHIPDAATATRNLSEPLRVQLTSPR